MRLLSATGGHLQLLPIRRCRPVEYGERSARLPIHGLLLPTVDTWGRTASITRLALSAVERLAQRFGPLQTTRQTAPKPKGRKTLEVSWKKFYAAQLTVAKSRYDSLTRLRDMFSRHALVWM